MYCDSKPYRFFFTSPWTLLLFLVIPCTVILSFTLNVRLPLADPAHLLGNNILCAFFVALRFIRYLFVYGKKLRYSVGSGRPRREGMKLSVTAVEARRLLTHDGYTFTPDGGYGEKRDLGYPGTILLYGGLLIVLAVGSWDNLCKFSGVLLDGMGPGTDLNSPKSYNSLNRGPLTPKLDSLPQLVITGQTLPDGRYPRGSTDIILVGEDGAGVKHRLIPREPVRCGDYDLYMAKLVFQPELVIKSRDSQVLYDNLVSLDPLVEKRGDFSFYGAYVGNGLVGGVYYQPERSQLMVVVTRNGHRVVTDLQFQVDQQVVQGEYIVSCAKMGQWSEIHVVRRRHKNLLRLGGFLAFAGLLMRVGIRAQRVWLQESGEGCTAWCTGDGGRRLRESTS